jgi:hypothetical protein
MGGQRALQTFPTTRSRPRTRRKPAVEALTEGASLDIYTTWRCCDIRLVMQLLSENQRGLAAAVLGQD